MKLILRSISIFMSMEFIFTQFKTSMKVNTCYIFDYNG